MLEFRSSTDPKGVTYTVHLANHVGAGKNLADHCSRSLEISVIRARDGGTAEIRQSVVTANLEGTLVENSQGLFDIVISEVGNPFASDEYNKRLLRNGPQRKFRFRVNEDGNGRLNISILEDKFLK